MYGNFILLEQDGNFENAKRVYLADVRRKNEEWLRDTLFTYPEIIPVLDVDSTFGPCARRW